MDGRLRGRRIAIAGGGIAGLAAATALAQRGARVVVAEQGHSLREFGAGLQVSPNGLTVLRALGITAEPAGCVATGLRLTDGRSDRAVLTMPLGAEAPYVFLHRGRLLGLLAEAAQQAGAEIRTGCRVAPDHPPMVDGAPPDLLIGADGLHSQIRPAVTAPEPAAFTGQVAWRAVIPLEPGAAPVVTVAMGPGRHLVSYPLDTTTRNVVAVEERATWAEERWDQPDRPEAVQAAFAGFAPPVRDWLARLEEVHLWGLFRHPVATRWHRDGMAILGDAAHPTLPFLAQGANMALEDAWTLAAHLDRTDQGAALEAWQAARIPRVRRIVAAAQANARNYHLRGPLRAAAHLALRLSQRVAPDAAARRFDWLYRHDVTQD